MRTSRLAAIFAAASAALATVDAAGATAPPPSDPDHAAAFEFAECMRGNGIDDFPDPQISEDGAVLISPPAGVGPEELAAAEQACQHILPASDGPAPSGPGPAGASEWERIVPGGDCECADVSEFYFFERRADPTKVVLFLEGGGACWDPETCAFTTEDSTTYTWNATNEDRAFRGGIFNRANPDNPFADFTFIFVPYCTGDVHLGNVTREYSPELTVEHNGFVNGTTALTYLVENYPDATQVVVAGASAGSVAAPVYGGLVADLLPDAQVTVVADGSGAYPNDPDVNVEILGQWGVFETMPDWDVNDGLTARDWGIPQFWVQAGLHDPDIVMARFDFAYDEVQTFFMDLAGLDTSDLAASIDANESLIEAAGVVQHSYTAAGTDHVIVSDDLFYTIEVNGVTLADWVTDLIAGEDIADVACEHCQDP
jgi:Pectinacetylesterase